MGNAGSVVLNAGLTAAPAAYINAAPAVAAIPVATAPVASTASVAEVPAVPHAQQFHTQDEFGNLAFGYSSPNSARYEEGNSVNGVGRGGYSWVDANGFVQRTEYVVDPILGFQATKLPPVPVGAAIAT